jgi:hypothetical protein
MRLLIILMNLLILIFGAPVWTLFGVAFAWCDLTVGLFGLGMLVTFALLIRAEAAQLRLEDDLRRSGRRDADDDGGSRAA